MDDKLDEIDRALLVIIQTIAKNHGLSLECYIRRLYEKVFGHPVNISETFQ